MRAPRELSSGRVQAAIVDGDVVDVRLDGLQVVERVTPTLRDSQWRTLPIRRNTLDVAAADDAATIAAEHREIGGHRPIFAWQISMGLDDGGFEVDVLATALTDVEARRIGLCLLLPWHQMVGARFDATGPAGRTQGVIQHGIAPQYFRAGSLRPMFPAFSRLRLDLRCGLHLDVRLGGEVFELEDQRNWTDPTFKIYPTPLAESAPRWFRAGDRIRQTVRVDTGGRLRTRRTRRSSQPQLTVRMPAAASRLPAIGLTATTPTPEVMRLLGVTAPNHIRLSGRSAVAPPPVGDVQRIAHAAAATIELALVLDPGGAHLEDWLDLASLAPVARVLVHRLDGVTASAADLAASRTRLSGTSALLVGGTADQFSQLNRLPCTAEVGDGVAFAITPQTHRVDEESMTATLTIQRQVVESAVAAYPRRPIIVSPVTLAMHDPADERRPDSRLTSSFAGAWTIGSYVQLALGGATSVTFHEDAEHYAPAVGRPLPPAAEAVALAARSAGQRMIPVHTTSPRVVMGIAGLAEDGVRTLLVTNLREASIEVELIDGEAAEPPRPLRLEAYAFARVGLRRAERSFAGR